ncbi:MAG: hypothetical protein JKX73_09875 [Flavobacteriales bacterium]|nr:hypothetical protein [Flavobacteriales bacterium]
MKALQVSTLALIFILTIGSNLVHSQARDMVFHTVGFSAFGDLSVGPKTANTVMTPGWGLLTSEIYTTSAVGYSFYTIIYRFRYNLVESGSNFAVGAVFSPALALSMVGVGNSDGGFGSFSLPMYLSAEFGAGSTYSSTSDVGGFIAVGPEFMMLPIIGGNVGGDYPDLKKSYIQVAFEVGVRFWNKKNRLIEVAFKYGMGKNESELYSTYDSEVLRFSKVRSYRLSWLYILNY